ncbi:hypothetical protein ACH42_03350 [Endozoicomonas sp. (ex Bugula neritina AB1)]|nr:hypothetical protein ACH42_03350 [Endozoicomonas sp. (ex Bugula neritina AB1)]
MGIDVLNIKGEADANTCDLRNKYCAGLNRTPEPKPEPNLELNPELNPELESSKSFIVWNEEVTVFIATTEVQGPYEFDRYNTSHIGMMYLKMLPTDEAEVEFTEKNLLLYSLELRSKKGSSPLPFNIDNTDWNKIRVYVNGQLKGLTQDGCDGGEAAVIFFAPSATKNTDVQGIIGCTKDNPTLGGKVVTTDQSGGTGGGGDDSGFSNSGGGGNTGGGAGGAGGSGDGEKDRSPPEKIEESSPEMTDEDLAQLLVELYEVDDDGLRLALRLGVGESTAVGGVSTRWIELVRDLGNIFTARGFVVSLTKEHKKNLINRLEKLKSQRAVSPPGRSQSTPRESALELEVSLSGSGPDSTGGLIKQVDDGRFVMNINPSFSGFGATNSGYNEPNGDENAETPQGVKPKNSKNKRKDKADKTKDSEDSKRGFSSKILDKVKHFRESKKTKNLKIASNKEDAKFEKDGSSAGWWGGTWDLSGTPNNRGGSSDEAELLSSQPAHVSPGGYSSYTPSTIDPQLVSVCPEAADNTQSVITPTASTPASAESVVVASNSHGEPTLFEGDQNPDGSGINDVPTDYDEGKKSAEATEETVKLEQEDGDNTQQ